ncbi:hypothetical protein SVIOM74S_07724 [Streptomyces violarus]
MAERRTPSRERIVAGAADMISRRGLSATSIREMAKHAKAPLGSTYHYFPEGKQQLATEAVRYTGEWVARSLRKELEPAPPRDPQLPSSITRKVTHQAGDGSAEAAGVGHRAPGRVR